MARIQGSTVGRSKVSSSRYNYKEYLYLKDSIKLYLT